MVKRSWLYGLMVFLAQTCNPYYTENDTRNSYEDEIVFEDQIIEDGVLIPDEALELEEAEPAPPPPMPEPAPPPPMTEESIFQVVEDMPRFPGCEDGKNKMEKKKCAEGKMIDFLSNHIVYPKIAKENGIEGRVILQFVVEKNGSISNVRVLRDPGGGCGKEAERVVKSMPNWVPGKQRGKPVKVRYILPVSFKLPKEAPKSKN